MKKLSLTDNFLIAMPSMIDPYFGKSITYICEHNDQGALGVVVNRPTEFSLGKLYQQVDIPLRVAELETAPVFFGGPVQMERGFVLHSPIGNWQSTLAINDKIGLTSSRDILEQIAIGNAPKKFLVTLGYAGWEAGQLEHELSQNSWLTVPASSAIIFDLPIAQRLPAAMQMLGVNFANLNEQAGHA